jgi:hypothetical protein
VRRTAIWLLVTAACGGEGDSNSTGDMRPGSTSPPAASRSERAGGGLLCDRIDDDEALTPPGAEPLDMPDLAGLSSGRRCVFVVAADMPIQEVREFYRSALADRGYEVADWTDGEGIARGNLARTFIRATKPGLHVHLTIDEFDPEATPLSDHRIHVKFQFDEVG